MHRPSRSRRMTSRTISLLGRSSMATLKTCFKCSSTKSLDEFYRHPRMADGHLNKCKECAKRDVGEHRLLNIERVRQYDRERATLPHRLALSIRQTRRYRNEHPNRAKANAAVARALRSGLLRRQPCWVCGGRAVAHHPDYDAPLDVVWLCQVHHTEAHSLVE